jgi:hypothetical protein
MSPYTNFHAPRKSLSERIQIGHKSGFYLLLLFFLYYYYSFIVNVKPPGHRFGFSLAWDWQYVSNWMIISSFYHLSSRSMYVVIMKKCNDMPCQNWFQTCFHFPWSMCRWKVPESLSHSLMHQHPIAGAICSIQRKIESIIPVKLWRYS